MKSLRTIAFLCYGLVGLLGFVFAYIYLSRPEFMPYHADAVGMSWNEVDASIKVLIIALMRVSGGGWLAISLSITLLLVARIKFQKIYFGFALVLVGLGGLIPTLYATLYVRANSPADPPWMAAAGGILLLIIALVLDCISHTISRKKN